MKTLVPGVLRQADVVISSYLGAKDRPELRKLRLGYHVRQREELFRIFGPKVKVVSICSGYTKAEEQELRSVSDKVDTEKAFTDPAWGFLYYPKRMAKWEKHNLVLKELYQQVRPKAVLLLDDDVVPRPFADGDYANGLVNVPSLIGSWLDDPSLMAAPCVYFACQGLLFDSYWKSNKSVLGDAPLGAGVTGWAVMARNDLEVLHHPDPELCEDVSFRVRCAAEGKQVLKHYRAFFKTMQGKSEKADAEQSTWFSSRADRKDKFEKTMAFLRKTYPQVFERKAKSAEPRTGTRLFK